MATLVAEDFSLDKTLCSGQVFRWQRTPQGFLGTIEESAVLLAQSGRRLTYSSHDGALKRKTLSRYLGLHHPLKSILSEVSRDARMAEAARTHFGLRVVQAPRLECLVSFILSAYSNIPRITRSLEPMARRKSAAITNAGARCFAFPPMERLMTLRESTLRSCGLGYRAPYVRKAIIAADQGFLQDVTELPYLAARDRLKTLPGVGDKVADCVLLFSFGFLEAFPIDVWMDRVLARYDAKGSYAAKSAFARDYFGRYAGYAQQYLFHNERTTL